MSGEIARRQAAFAGRPARRLLIDGAWVPAASGETFSVLDPASGERIAEAAAGSAADIDCAVAAARRSFERRTWLDIPAPARARIFFNIADLIDSASAEFVELEVFDNGMPALQAQRIVGLAAEAFRYFGGWITKIHGTTSELNVGGSNFHAYTLREPAGVAGLIVPWNGPVLFAAQKLAVSLAAGCSVVLKPAEETPLSALKLGELLLQAGIPAGVANVVTGFGETAGAALAAHEDVDKVAFTGSTEVGRSIIKAAAGNLKKVTLELGGKSPVIVFDDADLAAASAGAAMGIFSNAGQTCIAGSRLFVHRKVYDEVVGKIAAIAKSLKVGRGFDPTTQMGPLISERQRERVISLIQSAMGDGGQALSGGGRLEGAGYFVQPTVLTGLRRGARILREEVFGPVIAVTPFDDIDEVVELANDTVYGLAAAIWTRDIGRAHGLARRIRAGTVWLNCQRLLDYSMPFGGYKQSGWGRESGWEGLEAFLQTKAVYAAL